MGHAILATRIASYTVNHAILVPIDILEHFGITAEMTSPVSPDSVGHKIAWRFPSLHVAGWNRPGRAGQVSFAGEKLEIDWRSEKCVPVHPVIHLGELLHGRSPGKEEVLRLQIEPGNHVLLGRVVIVAGRDG